MRNLLSANFQTRFEVCLLPHVRSEASTMIEPAPRRAVWGRSDERPLGRAIAATGAAAIAAVQLRVAFHNRLRKAARICDMKAESCQV